MTNKLMKTFIYILAFVLIAGFLWLRFSPNDVDRWHVDPGDADEAERAQVRLIGLEAPRYTGDADDVLEAFIKIALADPGVKIMDGNVDEGMITFVARSRVGFRDYITVKAVGEAEQKTKLAIAARSRIRGYDWGKNAARIDRWLQQMEHTFAR